MTTWWDQEQEIIQKGSNFDILRRKYLASLNKHTKRNIVIYYSGWLQNPENSAFDTSINDNDKTGFMTVFNGLDKSKGLDLILHTPGGSIEATESLSLIHI